RRPRHGCARPRHLARHELLRGPRPRAAGPRRGPRRRQGGGPPPAHVAGRHTARVPPSARRGARLSPTRRARRARETVANAVVCARARGRGRRFSIGPTGASYLIFRRRRTTFPAPGVPIDSLLTPLGIHPEPSHDSTPCAAVRGTMCLAAQDRKSTRLNSSHVKISYAV